jgi:hypothetical protein
MHTRQWKATWRDQQGEPQAYVFLAPDNRVIAGVDFQFRLLDQGRPVPEIFELEEGRQVVTVVPSLREVARRGQL